ncbi:MAG: adenosylcobalamin-dependent ribonucleoside-diphosphate reductase [Candidatus Diapherotrites archaeon]|nr:adenosylcobalamin-dependent ribonucleoside-diphosphate reductase [Candidatus Diapherotrites archaeon]
MAQAGFSEIRKRNGDIAKFSKKKIVLAIWKAAQVVGGKDRGLADRLADLVIDELNSKFDEKSPPNVEQVQDCVEKVLMTSGHAKTAKAFILYRQARAEIRKEKMVVLEKEEIDEVDKRFDLNALKVLKARYLRRSEEGKLVEAPKQLFTRVAVHVALPDMLYDEKVFDKTAKQKAHPAEEFDCAANDGKFSVGMFKLNQFHLEGFKRLFDRLNMEKKMVLPWHEILKLLESGYFDKFEGNISEFYDLMTLKKFLPNTPAIANFGNPLGMGSACFVLDVPDSLEDIMETLKNTALVFKSGGGMGYNFSKLRPEGDFVSTTSGIASGPLSFMRLFDTMTEVIKQGGIRRGANMGILNSNHPDVEKFIVAKKGNMALRNFNISVLIMPDFWGYYERNEPYPLVNPRTGEVLRHVNPRMLFDMIVYQAWESAEPGVIFFDHVNEFNPFFAHLGPIVTTNPCGEVLLYPNEPCNLGSVNVWAFAKEDEEGKVFFDWDEMAGIVRLSTRFLDNVIDINNWPLPQIEEMALNTRKIGLGVMGFGDLLYEISIRYDSEDGRAFMERLMEAVNYHSKLESVALAKSRGALPYFNKSFYPEGRLPFSGSVEKDKWHFDWNEVSEKVKSDGIRNGYTTIIAPTGSISMIAGCSSGMEPVFSLVFEKNVKVGSFYYVDPVFEKAMKKEGLYDEKLMEQVSENGGMLHDIPYIPEHLKEVFVTAREVSPENHIRALAAFQKWTDSSISKTNNFPADATVDDMRMSYLLAYKLGCKDVTVFRDSSIMDQVLVAPIKKAEKKESPALQPAHKPSHETANAVPEEKGSLKLEMKAVEAIAVPKKKVEFIPNTTIPKFTFEDISRHGKQQKDIAFSKAELKDCPECSNALQFKEGCLTCPDCGWGLCK